MMSDLIGMLVGQSVADATRHRKEAGELFPGGDPDSISGAASAALGSFGLLLGLSAVLVAIQPDTEGSLAVTLIIAVIAFGCASFGIHFGRRAPMVTRRFLGLARYGVLASLAGVLLVVASPVIWVIRSLL